MNKKVSICIPTYNHTFFLRKSLQSILNQSYKNYEVVITDDSDNVAVKDLIDEFDFGGKLFYFKNKQALGTPENWNYCISKASGEYIKIIHHDDWLSKDTSLEELVALLESEADNNFAFCGCDNLSTEGENLFHHSITDVEASIISTCPAFLFFGNRIGAPSVIIFKKNKLRFDQNIKYLVDVEFYIELLQLNNKFSYTKNSLINIGHSNSQVTNLFMNNRNLLIFEYSYTFQKLIKTKENFRWCFKAFWDLFESLGILSVDDLKYLHWEGEIPNFIIHTIKFRKFLKKTGLFRFQRTVYAVVFNFCKLVDL